MDIRKLESNEQSLILPLWEVCFPDFWEQLAVKNGKIPYEEISFAAFDGEKAVGHCGIIPYQIFCGGKIYSMAGIASVATLPEFRNLGIARDLCNFSAQYAEENGFESAPLYTAYFRVYESANWRKLSVPPTLSVRVSGGVRWLEGCELAPQDKQMIASIYENAGNFDGKIIRQTSGTLHSWERIFTEPDFRFAVGQGSYAVKLDETVIELNFSGEVNSVSRYEFFDSLAENGVINFYLPPTEDILPLISGFPQTVSSADAMHGELPMIRDFGSGDFHRRNDIFFPVVDKF